MYMYYLLGHRIMDSHMSVEDRQLEADNTYILAIDGDSKFEPSAVLKLLRLMNVKNDIGCACGRIHPIGEGWLHYRFIATVNSLSTSLIRVGTP